MPQGRMQVLHEELLLTVGTLAAGAAVLQQSKIDSAREQGFKIRKSKYSMTYNAKTDGEGPILFGYAVGLNAAEVAEAIAADPQHVKDIPAVDEANRRVYPLEWLPVDGTESFRDFHKFLRRFSIPWSIDEGVTLSWFVHAFAALTSGMLVHIMATYYGEWMRD